MAIPVLILGDSGSGKTTALRNLDPVSTLLIQVIDKRLPFRAAGWDKFNKQTKQGSLIVTDNYDVIHKVFNAAHKLGKDKIIIDDTNYIMSNENMRRVDEKGFDKFTMMAKRYWQLIDHAQKLNGDIRIYFMSHTQESDNGGIKTKTIGKLLDQQIVIEGLFTIVLRCMALDGRHFFTTQTSGQDPVKTPIDMFTQHEIDNDLLLVDNSIKEYYNLEEV